MEKIQEIKKGETKRIWFELGYNEGRAEVLEELREKVKNIVFSGLTEQMKKMGLAIKCEWCGAGNGFETGHDNAINTVLTLLDLNKTKVEK